MTTHRIISSQRHLDATIVAEKQAAKDYNVTVYELEIGDETYRVVTDGHHSLAAAKADGAAPAYRAPDQAVASEYDYELQISGVEGWLEAHQIDSDWYDVETGELVF